MEMNNHTPILLGEVDTDSQDYILKEVKSIATQSVISKQQIQSLHHYLSKQKGESFVAITVNDQIPVMLTEREVKQVLEEIEQIMKQF